MDVRKDSGKATVLLRYKLPNRVEVFRRLSNLTPRLRLDVGIGVGIGVVVDVGVGVGASVRFCDLLKRRG